MNKKMKNVDAWYEEEIMIVDYCKRIIIAAVIAVFICMLFVGVTVSYASTVVDSDLLNSKIWPTIGEVTDTYGTRNGSHFGIDIAAPEGTDVYAIDEGIVTRSYYSDTYGHVIFIEHPVGLETVYAHLHERIAEEGDMVVQGEKIGTVGNTGRSSGNHLHFEVHEGGWNIDKSNSIDPFLVLMDEQRTYALTEEEKREIALVEIQEVLTTKYSVAEEGPTTLAENIIPYVVKKGDTLWSLSRQNGLTVTQLKELNSLTNESIQIGQVMMIPKVDTTHVVLHGDTLFRIARETGVTVQFLMEHNELSNDIIQPGMVLNLR